MYEYYNNTSNPQEPVKICIPKLSNVSHKEVSHMIKNNAKRGMNRGKLKAAFFTSKKWPIGSEIKIKFLEDPPSNIERTSLTSIKNTLTETGKKLQYDPLQETVDKMDIKEAVKLIVKERLQPYVGLTFTFVENTQDANIRISFNTSDGAWSLIGTDCNEVQTPGQDIQTEATMNLGWFDVATTIHEFGHALGMIHEHQNPAGEKIKWDEQAVYEWANRTQGWDQGTAYAQIMEPYEVNQINGSNFDPDSIMLYFFPGSLTTDGVGTHENLRLSQTDVDYINKQYPTSNSNKCGDSNCLTPQQFYQKSYGVSNGFNVVSTSSPTGSTGSGPINVKSSIGNTENPLPQILRSTVAPTPKPNKFLNFLKNLSLKSLLEPNVILIIAIIGLIAWTISLLSAKSKTIVTRRISGS